MITLQPITEENFLEAASLKVTPEQQKYVAQAPIIISRAYAYRSQSAVCWAICAKDKIIGLAMIHDMEEEPSCYHLAELIIDASQQGKGYGQMALKLILDICRRERKFDAVEVCVKRANTAAIHVYEKAGFRDTGYQDPDTPDGICMRYMLPQDHLEISFRNIVLRDMVTGDIADEIRWITVETEWALWDAPWEMEVELPKFDPVSFTMEIMDKLQRPKEEPRWGFELDTVNGIHIGRINSYLIDDNWDWIPLINVKFGQKVYRTLGLDICESRFCNRGLGKDALCAFIQYYLQHGETELCIQTWSGNLRMIRCAEKIGFMECSRKVDFRHVRGGTYDGLTFLLDLNKFYEYLAENP